MSSKQVKISFVKGKISSIEGEMPIKLEIGGKVIIISQPSMDEENKEKKEKKREEEMEQGETISNQATEPLPGQSALSQVTTSANTTSSVGAGPLTPHFRPQVKETEQKVTSAVQVFGDSFNQSGESLFGGNRLTPKHNERVVPPFGFGAAANSEPSPGLFGFGNPKRGSWN